MDVSWSLDQNDARRPSTNETAYIRVGAVVHAGTDEADEFMATLVNDQRAN